MEAMIGITSTDDGQMSLSQAPQTPTVLDLLRAVQTAVEEIGWELQLTAEQLPGSAE